MISWARLCPRSDESAGKERLQTLGNPFAFFDEIGNALSQVTGRERNASAVNLSSSNIVTEILSVLTPVAAAPDAP